MSDELKNSALHYHRHPRPGKLEIKATKPLANARDLALAYSPGVAYACTEIAEEPVTAAEYTARGNLVAVVTNGTAVLGLGAIGPLASKPVMEGKAVLFKAFADIDVFDIEVDERDPSKFIETVARLEPSFGGINLEDIKAPECFVIEQGLKERMNIPVFHDDQHGTAIVVAAAVYNGLRVVGKAIDSVKLVASGAGAAALACLDLLVVMGLRRENVVVTDIAGVVYEGRPEEMDPYKARYAVDTPIRTLEEALEGADLFLGLSAGGVLKPAYLRTMAPRPLILALANPVPEILPDLAAETRPDAIIATGRSDFPNQVNNVLCFPFLFRGALDVGATGINEAMKMAAVEAIADLARTQPSELVLAAYGGQSLSFGPDYLLPKPFDPRLMAYVAPAVAQAAMDSGIAQRPIADMNGYRKRLEASVFRTGMVMRPLFDLARQRAMRVAYAEGEEEKVLQTVQQVVEQGIARPVVVGRRRVVEARIEALGLEIEMDEDFDLMDPEDDDAYRPYVAGYVARVARRGYTDAEARRLLGADSTVLAAMLLERGRVDAMICGTRGRYADHLKRIDEVVGLGAGVEKMTSLSALVMHAGTLFITDAHVQEDPGAEEIAEMVRLCAGEVRWFGLTPRVALLSSSDFGGHDSKASRKMRRALELVRQRTPDIEVDGEMHADTALSIARLRQRAPDTRLSDAANLLVMPSRDAANIAFNLLRALGDATPIGPILVGGAKSAHVVTPAVTVRGLLNMTAVAAVRAV